MGRGNRSARVSGRGGWGSRSNTDGDELESDQGDPAAQVGHAGAVRRVLRGEGKGVLLAGRARRDPQGRRADHHSRAGRARQAGGVRHRLGAEHAVVPRRRQEDHANSAGVLEERHDRAHLEGQRHHDDRKDARQEGRGLVLRERAGALRGIDQERDRSEEQETTSRSSTSRSTWTCSSAARSMPRRR